MCPRCCLCFLFFFFLDFFHSVSHIISHPPTVRPSFVPVFFLPNSSSSFLRLGSFSRLGFFLTSLALLTSRRSSSRRLLLRLILLGSTLSLVALRRSPQGQVVTQELHDQSAVPVALLRQRVELSNGVIERLLGQVAGTVGRVEDFIVEDGEVESETETDGVRGGQVSLRNVGGVLFPASQQQQRRRRQQRQMKTMLFVKYWMRLTL